MGAVLPELKYSDAALEVALRPSPAALRRGRHGACAILLTRSGEIAVRVASGAWPHGVVRDGSFVAPWRTIVRWRPEGSRLDRAILAPARHAGEERFRSLRVWSRWS